MRRADGAVTYGGVPANLDPATEETIARAAQLLRADELVAFPTETVYGLGGDATSEVAVARIFAAKGRPRFNPLIVHVPGLAEAEALRRELAAALKRRGPSLIEVPVGEMPDPWPTLIMPHIRGRA